MQFKQKHWIRYGIIGVALGFAAQIGLGPALGLVGNTASLIFTSLLVGALVGCGVFYLGEKDA